MSKAKTGRAVEQCLYQQTNTNLHGDGTAGPKGTAPGDAKMFYRRDNNSK